MKFKLKNTKENISTLTRKISYRYLRKDEKTHTHVLVRALEGGGYPRFHLYLKIDKKTYELFFNLHLDQKKPVYETARAHAAEYEGEALEEEARRIKELLKE